jgi:hypothetical protein
MDDLHVADHDPDLRSFQLEVRGHIHRLHETAGGGGQPDQLRLGGQHVIRIGLDALWRVRSQAVMHLGRMAVLLQPGRQLQYADRRHAVGQYGKIRLPGHEVETGGVDKGDFHVFVRL